MLIPAEQPNVGVVQPLNAVVATRVQANQQNQPVVPDTQKYKALNRRNIPPHVPPRNDQGITEDLNIPFKTLYDIVVFYTVKVYTSLSF